jgi:hypothetical protein
MQQFSQSDRCILRYMAKNKFADLLSEVGLPAGGTAAAPNPMLPSRIGKRSDPAYRQISTYVRSDLYRTVKRELLLDDRDFSDLMDELLAEWVGRRKVG